MHGGCGTLDKGKSMKCTCVRVEKKQAMQVHEMLLSQNILDRNKHPVRDDKFVYFPVLDVPEGFEIVEMDCEERNNFIPISEIARKLDMDEKQLPDKWEKFGDVLVLKLPHALYSMREKICAAYADVLGAKTVLIDVGGITGELRKPVFEVAYGGDTVTVHREAGVLFKFDVMKIMFSSGNVFERSRLLSQVEDDEVIVDMFAGIGYFTIPLALKTKVARIYACEKNPEAYAFLRENINLNRVGEKVVPLPGDCREVAPRNVANRVIMGYVKDTHLFLSTARMCLKNGKGYIHYHDLAKVDRFPDEMVNRLREHITDFEITGLRVVKSYAPGVVHGVLDVKVKTG
jgi:tRNA wybutosine-synthesizing protein 2